MDQTQYSNQKRPRSRVSSSPSPRQQASSRPRQSIVTAGSSSKRSKHHRARFSDGSGNSFLGDNYENTGNLTDRFEQIHQARLPPLRQNLTNLPGNSPYLQGNFGNMAGLSETDQQIADLQAQLAASQQAHVARGATASKKKRERSDEMEKLIAKTVKDVTWRTVKYVTSDKQEQQLAIMVLDNLGLDEYLGNDAETQARRQVWLSVYASYCTQELNKTRSYVISRLKEAAFEYMDAHDGKLPSPAQIISCGKRVVTVPAMRTLFEWYVDKYLVRAAGNTTHWNENKRLFEIISECHFPGEPTKYYITASTEAFACIVFDGYSLVWKNQWQLKKDNKKAKIPVPRRKKGVVLTAQQKSLRSKYTDMDNGQTRFGGWNTEAIRKFTQLKDLIKEARALEPNLDVERDCMASLKVEHGLEEEETLEEYLSKKKKSKKTSSAPVVEEIDCFGDED